MKQHAPVVSGREAVRDAYRQDNLADDYIRSRYESDPFGRATHDHQVRLLRKILTRLHSKRVLEVAPGPARLTVHLPRVEYGCAIEQSLAMIRLAEERLREFGRDDWRVQQGDAFELPFQSGEFDTALSFKLIRHFDRDERLRLLDNLRQAVAPGGYVILDVANDTAYRWLHAKWGVTNAWIDDYWFTAASFRDEAREAGFVDVQLHPVQPMIQAQYYCWCHATRRWPAGARALGRALEQIPWGQPLEWIAVCKCA